MSNTLGSDKQLALLNDIDKLRSFGVSQYVNLPQLIVCGDQSSGKSSVLEAISGIPFPTKDNLCTRFATEVILRHTDEAKVSVAIIPGPARSEEEQKNLQAFRQNKVNVEHFSELIDNAKVCMGVTTSSSAFSTDVLRLEISGPTQPHLTIVDLPGLIHSENRLQTAEDVQVVQNMVYDYMINRRSIILAIISAKNDFANQIVLKLARQVDPQGKRTIGVITKPDTLPAGSESEAAFLSLARNTDIVFRLGWHVLKNRSYETRELPTEARDDAEREFLSQGAWKDLARTTVGVYALRERLSKILFNQIQAELPTLIEDIEGKLSQRRSTLAKLGPNRGNFDQQRLFLLQISQEYQAISKAALDGSYEHTFFGEARSINGYSKRLRAVIQNLNVEFAKSMRLRGHQRRIVGQKSENDESKENPTVISRADYIEDIRQLLSITRGRELPGMFNPLIVGDLFRDQSKPWEKLARSHLENSWQAARSFLDLLIGHLADEPTVDALMGQVIDPLMEEKLRAMNRKLDELLKPHQTGHSITYNHYFTETIQKIKEKRHEADIARRLREFLGHKENSTVDSLSVKNARIPSLLSALTSKTEADMDRFACSEILDCMEAYYKVAMKSFIDSVAIHAIEYCLVAEMSSLFSPSSVLQMEEDLLSTIAAETQQNQTLREQMQRETEVLEKGLSLCRMHMDRKALNRTDRSRSSFPSFKPPNLQATKDDDDDSSTENEGLAEGIAGLPESVQITPGLDIMPQSEHSQPDLPVEPEPDSPLASPSWSIPIPSAFSFEKAKQPAFIWPPALTPNEELQITPSISKKSKKKKKESPA